MGSYKKIKEISLKKLNNAEYLNLASRTAALVEQYSAAALGIVDEEFLVYKENIAKMTDVVNQSQASDETLQMAEADAERDALLVYILGVVRNGRTLPIAAQKEAALSLYNVTKPYTGMQNKPNQQETQLIKGLLADLAKEGNAANVEALGLASFVEELRAKNELYSSLTDSRAAAQVANSLETGKTVRAEMDTQYDDMMDLATATNILNASEASEAFVTAQNHLIDEIRALYKQRTAGKNAEPAESPDEPGTPETEEAESN